MRNLLVSITLTLILINSSYSQDGWFYLDSGLQNNEYGAIDVLNSNDVFVISDGGKFLKTTDGGENWTIQDLDINENFYDIYFLNNDYGIAVGANGTLIKTENGGNDWIIIPLGINDDLRSIFINNLNSIWVVGNNGIILFSDDSGNSWSINNSITTGNLNGVFFRSENEGYITGVAHTLIRTTDGGVNWGCLWFGFHSYFSSLCKTENYLYMLSDTFQVLISTDGINWGGDFILPSPVLDLYFQNDNLGFCIQSDCTTNGDCFIGISKSINSGQTWTTSFNDNNPPNMISYQSNDIEFATDEIGYALSGNNILKTIDGGTFINVNEFSNKNLLKIYPNPTNGILTITTDNSNIKRVEIDNTIGQRIFNGEYNNKNVIRIDISNFPNGTYFIKIENENGNLSNEKVIKI